MHKAHSEGETYASIHVSKAMGAGLLGTLGQMMLVYGVAPLMAVQAGPRGPAGHACPLGLLMHVLSGSVGFPAGVCGLAPLASLADPS